MSQMLLPRATATLHRTAMRSSITHQPFHAASPKSRLSTSKQPPKPSQNPSFPTVSLKELGANRTVKIVVIIALTIGGTAETIFWAKMLWAKFGPGEKEEEEDEGESES